MRAIAPHDVTTFVALLRAGGMAVFPTETSYGLGCDATNAAAVAKIFAVKGRDPGKPLLIVVPTVDAARHYLQWNETLDRLAGQYWPGPLTIVGWYQTQPVGGKLHDLAPGVVSATGTLAVRVTKYPWLLEVLKRLKTPLVATSANKSGQEPLYDSALISRIFYGERQELDIVVNAGLLPKEPPTTMVSVVDGGIRLLRQGGVQLDPYAALII